MIVMIDSERGFREALLRARKRHAIYGVAADDSDVSRGTNS